MIDPEADQGPPDERDDQPVALKPPMSSVESAERYLLAACIPEEVGQPFIDPSRLFDELGTDQEIFQTEWLRQVFFRVVYPLSEDHGAGQFDESDVGREMDRMKIYAPGQSARSALGCEAMIATLLVPVAERRVLGEVPRPSAEGVEMRIRQMMQAHSENIIRKGAKKAYSEDPIRAALTMAKAVKDSDAARPDVKTKTVTLAEYLELGGPSPRENRGASTGLSSVDDLFTFQPRRVYTLLAETSTGKTCLAGQMAESMVMQGKHVVWFSTEMSIEESAQRTTSRRTGIPLTDLQTGRLGDRDWEMIREARATLCAPGGEFSFASAIGMSMIDLVATLRAVGKDRPPDFVVVDHFSDLRRESAREDRDIARDMQIAKGLASDEFEIPILIVVQPSREGKNSGNLKKEHAKGGGAIEDAADVSMVMTRVSDADDAGGVETVKLYIGKHRNGRRNVSTELIFNGPCVHFSEV